MVGCSTKAPTQSSTKKCRFDLCSLLRSAGSVQPSLPIDARCQEQHHIPWPQQRVKYAENNKTRSYSIDKVLADTSRYYIDIALSERRRVRKNYLPR